MQQKKTYKLVGLFVIIGFVCFIGIIMRYAGNQLMDNKDNLVVMYFEESISGLNVGSSVVFKGVEVGKVADIKLWANLQEGTFKIPVIVAFDPKRNLGEKINKAEMSNREVLNRLIKKGLRARLASANLLTGQLMIELVMDPKVEAVFRGSGQYLEVPTELSPFALISQDLEEVSLRESLSRLGNIIEDLEDNLPQILENTTRITEKLDKALDRNSGEASQSMKSFNSAMEEISKTSRSIKNLTDYLERHPEALLRGKEK